MLSNDTSIKCSLSSPTPFVFCSNRIWVAEIDAAVTVCDVDATNVFVNCQNTGGTAIITRPSNLIIVNNKAYVLSDTGSYMVCDVDSDDGLFSNCAVPASPNNAVGPVAANSYFDFTYLIRHQPIHPQLKYQFRTSLHHNWECFDWLCGRKWFRIQLT